MEAWQRLSRALISHHLAASPLTPRTFPDATRKDAGRRFWGVQPSSASKVAALSLLGPPDFLRRRRRRRRACNEFCPLVIELGRFTDKA